ncbi:MAGUK p55 subfamily member 5-A [Thelohanellus kitauei]|uniref:MAGUK p55 subfamily member 5-A n=1 Tax=Thelohanellus kitauei TaxID=669202 RepID=A0A0C2JZC8_THEKT|nr:MAGUK p55 subfamily member 5-A [Thelohanellus kitauei]
MSQAAKSPRSLFRTDSQSKYETCIRGTLNYRTSKSSTYKNKKLYYCTNSCSKLFESQQSSKTFRFSRKIQSNGLNFETMQTVNLEIKPNENIGFTLVNGVDNSILIARIIKDQPADKSGLFKVNDEIFEVNEEPVKGMDIEDAISIIKAQKETGSISFLISKQSQNIKYKLKEPIPIEYHEEK